MIGEGSADESVMLGVVKREPSLKSFDLRPLRGRRFISGFELVSSVGE